ncbi:potassium-transporting ATPase subunit KdpC [bacterium]|nr:potassium-transporting ATPase subunit KdpC [bacterium]
MLRSLYSCGVLFVILSFVTGGLYPLLVTVIAQAAFPRQATGSLVNDNGKVIGSSLLAQSFTKPRYFWPRPSAAGYNAGASSGSNLGPTNPAILEAVATRAKNLSASEVSPVPVDLVTASASGLDPHITPTAAFYQAARIAKSRGLSEAQVNELIQEQTEERTLGLLGERRVNVLLLNLSLDALAAVE